MNSVCGKCGRTMKPGEFGYKVRIELISTYDGYIEEPDGDLDEELDRLIQILSREDPEEAAKDVAQTIQLVLCRACRNKLVKEFDVQDSRVFH